MAGYVFDFQGKQFDPADKVDVADTRAHNEMVEAQELAIWARKPDRHCAYVTGTKVATWLGTELGEICWSSVYRNNFGVKITSVRVRGNNGAMYYGSYGSDWSMLVRLRRCKRA